MKYYNQAKHNIIAENSAFALKRSRLNYALPCVIACILAAGNIFGLPGYISKICGSSPASVLNTGGIRRQPKMNARAAASGIDKVPTLSYPGPLTYVALASQPAVVPTSTNVAAFGYSAPVTIMKEDPHSVYDVAVDIYGDVYAALFDYRVDLLRSPNSYALNPSGWMHGATSVSGIATDVAGNLYYTNEDDHSVHEISTSQHLTEIGTSLDFTDPVSVALDGAGNVYISDEGDKTIKEIPVNGKRAFVIAAGFGEIGGVTADKWGSVFFVADNKIYKIAVGQSQPVAIFGGVGDTPVISDVAIDGDGNLFISSYSLDKIIELPAGSTTPIYIGSGFSDATAIAVDGKGNIYVADDGSHSIKKMTPIGGYFSDTRLPEGLVLNQNTGVISGTALVATASESCVVTAYNGVASKTYLFNIAVNPPAPPSVTYGAPEIYAQHQTIPALTPTASNIAPFAYGSTTTVVGLAGCSYVAIAGDGTMYGTQGNYQLVRILPTGVRSDILLTKNDDALEGLAVDMQGNVYVADNRGSANSNRVIKFRSGSTTPVVLASGLPYLAALAVDATGNVFVTDDIDGKLIKVPAAGGSFSVIASGLSGARQVAADGLGNVYVGQPLSGEAGAILKFAPGSGTGTLLGNDTFKSFQALAVDAAGDLFVVLNNQPTMIPVGTTTPVTIGPAMLFGKCIAVSPSGIVLESSILQAAQLKQTGGYFINKPLPQGLSFDYNTGIITGSPQVSTAPEDYTISAYNATGSASAIINITVGPFAINYGPGQSYPVGTAITPLNPGTGPVSVAYSNTLTTRLSATAGVTGVATNSAGTIFAALTNGTIQVLPNTGFSSSIGAGSGIVRAYGIAFDKAGNMYVSDAGDNTVKELPAGSTRALTLATGFLSPKGIAVDASGNVLVADDGNNAVKKIFANGHSVSAIGTGFSRPFGVAVDADGSVFVAEYTSHLVKEIRATDGSTIPVIGGFGHLTGICIDAVGTLYMSDNDKAYIRILPKGGYDGEIGSNLGHPAAVAVDGAGKVIIADAANNTVKVLSPANGYYINRSLPGGLMFDQATGVISGTPASVSPPADYQITGWYNSAVATATLNIGVYALHLSYNSPVSYTVGVPAAPLMPTADLVGPPGYSTTAQVIKKGLSQPFGLAIDGSGNIYVADRGAGKIYKIPAGGAPMVSVGSGFSLPSGIAVDFSGNIFVADQNNNAVKEILASTGATVTLGSGFSRPLGVSVDANGNVYVADTGNGAVKMIPAGGSAVVTVGTGFSSPQSVVADGDGNIYIAEGAPGNTIKRISSKGRIVAVLASNLDQPYGLTLDSAGNLFFSDNGNDKIKRIPATGEGIISYSAGLNGPNGLAIDSAGNLYVSDEFNGAVKKITPTGGFFISPSLPAGLKFDWISGTISGTPTTASPAKTYTVTAYNANGSASANINLQVNSNTKLSALGVSTGVLNPPFDPSIEAYTVSVPFITNSDKIIPAVTASGATITVNGTKVASGKASPPLNLVPGDNAFNVTVTGKNSVTSENYSVTITRGLPSADALLSSIWLNPGSTLTTVSGPGYLNYTTSVPNTETSLTVMAVQEDTSSRVKINGQPVASGSESKPIPLNVGQNAINIEVTAQDGITTKTYIITATRAASDNALLSSIKLNPATALTSVSGPGYANYTTVVPNSESNLTVTATQQGEGATIKINGQTVASGAASPSVPLNVGENVINIAVTAQDGVTTKNYIITAARAASDNALLSSIRLNPATTLTSVSGPGYANYTTLVPNGESSLTVTATQQGEGATIKINGKAVASGTASQAIPMSFGQNVINIAVTAQDGITTKTYIITATRAASDNALLSSIKLNPATALTSVSGPGYANYTTTIPNSETSLTVTATQQGEGATIKINGKTVASGTASQAIPLSLGQNLINITVNAQDGVTIKTYIITATRAASDNALLSSIKLNPATALTQVSGPGYLNYTTAVSNSETSLTVTPTRQGEGATIKINGKTVASGSASQEIALNVGQNKITIAVTAQDGVTTKNYIISVTRAASNNALLSSVKLNPATLLTTVSGPGYANYTTSIPNGETSLTVTATQQGEGATIKVNGKITVSGAASQAIPLSLGKNVINIAVTAQDGVTTKTYIITATRAASNNALLSSVKLTPATPLTTVSGPGYANYITSVPNSETSLTVTATQQGEGAIIKINGKTVASGTASQAIPLSLGQNAINIAVTAQDGVTTKTYIITATRAASDNALLSSVKLNPATILTSVSGPGYANYTTLVPNTESSLTVTATRQGEGATIQINGQTVASGEASQPIPVGLGQNVINIVVTAQDGVTRKTYIITATRNAIRGVVTKQYDHLAVLIEQAGINVHQGLSPNGDGDNDIFIIDGINNYPDNTLQVMNRGGQLVYQIKNYDNRSRAFDGHSNINGKLQPAGTYYYSLEYKDGGETKYKTGFIVLKY